MTTTTSKELTSVSLRKGYFDSQFNKSQLGIALARRQAFWDIDYDSGERYRFGDVTFEGSQIREEYLQNLVPFKRRLLPVERPAELNRRLSATGWFNSVVVAPEFDKSRKTRCCRCTALFRRAPRTPLKPVWAIRRTLARA